MNKFLSGRRIPRQPARLDDTGSAAIEPGVRPVCDALNAIPGVRTLWSCEGHPERPSRPYVTFAAPQEFAWRVHRLLGSSDGDESLAYCWWLVASFRDDGSLQYTIEPNDVRIDRSQRLALFPWRNLWQRDVMVRELRRLATLIATMNPAVTEGDYPKTAMANARADELARGI